MGARRIFLVLSSDSGCELSVVTAHAAHSKVLVRKKVEEALEKGDAYPLVLRSTGARSGTLPAISTFMASPSIILPLYS